MRIKSIVQRLTLIMLCLATMLSLSLSAFASGSVTGDSTGWSSAEFNGFKVGFDDEKGQGLRIAIIDTDGNYDGAHMVDIVPENFYYNNTGGGNTRVNYGSVGTDPNSDPNFDPKDNEAIDYSSKEIYAGMPDPLAWKSTGAKTGYFVGNGNNVKAWMEQDNAEGVQNIIAIVKENFGETIAEKVANGELDVSIEGIYNLPVYKDQNNYLKNSDGSAYRVTGTIRDYIKYELQARGIGTGGYMGTVVKAALQTFFLPEEIAGMQSMTEEELKAKLLTLINSGDLDKLGAGMHVYHSDKTPPPPPVPDPEPTPPEDGEDIIYITESRITRRKNLANVPLSGGSTLSSHEFQWKIEAFDTSVTECQKCSYDATHHKSKEITDKKNVINIEEHNKPEESNGVLKLWSGITDGGGAAIVPFIKSWSERTEKKQHYEFSGVGYNIVVIRKDDKIDLITYKTTGREGGILGASNQVVQSSNSVRTRPGNGQYSYVVSLLFKPNEGADGYDKITKMKHQDYSGSTWYDANGTRHHSHSLGAIREDVKETEFNEATTVNMNVTVIWDVYKGTPNGGTTNTVANGLKQIPVHDGKQETWLEIKMENGETKFHPYIKMQYENQQGLKNEVYVGGQYERTIIPNEYVGVIFELSENTGHNVVNTGAAISGQATKKGKLSISSNQWSTHATANNKVGNSNCVLPGGATLDIAILEGQRQKFTIEALTPILTGSGRTQVNATGSSGLPSEYVGTVQDNYIKYAKSVVESLEALSVQQYVSQATSDTSKLQSVTSDVWNMTGARAVSATSGTEDKYYFRPDKDTDPATKDKANMGDIDVKIGNQTSDYTSANLEQVLKTETKVTYYTFFTNTKGELRVKKTEANSSNLEAQLAVSSNITSEGEGTLVLAQGQDSSALTDAKIKKINEKTHIIDKIVAALETNKGSDSDAGWVGNGHWYNEAFDGITIAESVTELKLGFIRPFSRSSVIDPKLCPSSSSKSDILNSYVFSQLKMREYSEKWGSSEIGKLAEYKGNMFKTKDLDDIFKSDIFYIPNATVQDLR